MTTAVPAHGATPTRRLVVAVLIITVLIPAALTALLVANAARAHGEPPTSERTYSARDDDDEKAR